MYQKIALCKVLVTDLLPFFFPDTTHCIILSEQLYALFDNVPIQNTQRILEIYKYCLPCCFSCPILYLFPEAPYNPSPLPQSYFLIQSYERQNIPAKELVALCPVVMLFFSSPGSVVLCYKVKRLPAPLLTCNEREGRL